MKSSIYYTVTGRQHHPEEGSTLYISFPNGRAGLQHPGSDVLTWDPLSPATVKFSTIEAAFYALAGTMLYAGDAVYPPSIRLVKHTREWRTEEVILEGGPSG